MLLLKGLKKSYTERNGHLLPILDIAEFRVAIGEQMVVIGRSGCGKTTLLHVVAGISRPDEGLIQIDNTPVSALSEAGRDRFRAAKLGYVFQTFNLLDGFTAFENVMLGMTFAQGRKEPKRARELLDRVGLGHRLHHRPHDMSVGEQQRVAVARALANRPRLLLADEPTANIDPANQQLVVDLIRETCHEEQIALVLVTHTKEVADQFDRVDQLSDFNRIAETLGQGQKPSKSPAVKDR